MKERINFALGRHRRVNSRTRDGLTFRHTIRVAVGASVRGGQGVNLRPSWQVRGNGRGQLGVKVGGLPGGDVLLQTPLDFELPL